MGDYQRVLRLQALREAEGYLDLAMGLAEQWQVAPPLRLRLAQRALEALERVRGASGQRAHLLYLTGQAYRVMRRYDEAVPPLAAASELDSENIFIWLALAWCYKRTSRLDLAIEALENAVAVDAHEPVLHYNLACYWSLAGNPKIALRYLAQSFDMQPAYRELVADETDFDPIRDLPDFQALMGAIV